MAIKREVQVCLDSTPYYHCYVRCVRRAYLCGEDFSSGENYDHRKQWVVSRLKFLSYVYAIDLCAYAVMSNHYHVVLHVDKKRALNWSKEEVVNRWMQVCSGDVLVDLWLENPKSLDKETLKCVDETIEEWRERLYSISWFMRCVNETIARMANEEDQCKGRFWEGRFKSQALLDDVALLSCMAYVDLNPVRAGIAQELEDCDFSSIQQRLFEHCRRKVNKNPREKQLVQRVNKQGRIKELLQLKSSPEAPLLTFSNKSQTHKQNVLPFSKSDYFELLHKTNCLIQENQNKEAAIAQNSLGLKVFARLGIKPEFWLKHVKFFNVNYSFCVGRLENMRHFVNGFNRGLGKGCLASMQIYT